MLYAAIVQTVLTLAIVVFTGLYVYYTYGLLRESRATNEKQLALIQEQLRTNSLPVVYPQIFEENGLQICIVNSSSHPAYAINALVLVRFMEIEVGTLQKYISDRVELGYLSYVRSLTSSSKGWFGVSDSIDLDFLPPRHHLRAPMGFPDTSGYVSVMLQHRDIGGSNYLSIYNFAAVVNRKGEQSYRITSLCGESIPSERVEYGLQSGKDIAWVLHVGGSTQAAADMIQTDFAELLEHSFPAVWTGLDPFQYEDPSMKGEVEPLGED